VSRPAYMHSFGLTQRYIVLAEFPLVVNPLALALSGRPYIENYRWRPERGTRFTLIDRRTGRAAPPVEAEPCFAFHHVNAFEREGEVVVDVCAYPDAEVIADLYLERLRGGAPVRGATLTRFRLPAPGGSAGEVSVEALAEEDVELPRISYAGHNERPYRFVWGNGTGGAGWLERIVKVDVERGECSTWAEPDRYPGEPVFVPAPDAQEEDEGVLLSVVLDAAAERSFLLVLDASDLSEVARAEVPHHIPFSFHGQFFGE